MYNSNVPMNNKENLTSQSNMCYSSGYIQVEFDAKKRRLIVGIGVCHTIRMLKEEKKEMQWFLDSDSRCLLEVLCLLAVTQ